PLRVIAGALGIDQAILSKIERGQRLATRSQVLLLAEYYAVSQDLLLVSWLSDKLLNETTGEEMAIEALQVAESRVTYKNRSVLDSGEIIGKIKKTLQKFRAVKKAWIFGSYARNDYNQESDLDILIDVPNDVSFTLFDIAGICEAITQTTGLKADIVMRSAIRPAILDQINQEMKLIYEAQ
ncbi:MAG: nucleotidyltransferase domain-containing protein, partial [Bacteroidetes bacterium]|nr:nucleotidyltransferase domain-containing protein [Bacteroidota bacterium]